jgi:aminoglycoside phosphotransferase (APT) family kinase protein
MAPYTASQYCGSAAYKLEAGLSFMSIITAPSIPEAILPAGAQAPQSTEESDALAQAHSIIRTAMQVEPLAIERQTLSQSGNAVFRADLADGRTVVLRMSPLRGAFAYTAHNLNALREIGVPVQTVLASGAIPAGGSYVVMSWLPGRDLAFELPLMHAEEAAALADTIAACQQRVAALPRGQGFGWAAIGRPALASSWSDMFGRPVEEPLDEPPTPLNRLRLRLRGLRRALEPYFQAVPPVCFLDDITTKNVIVDKGRLSGLIDLDFACYGDPLLAVGNTLAQLAVQDNDAARAYGATLVQRWQPEGEARRAMHFYSALWLTTAIVAADAAGDAARVNVLGGIVHGMLDASGV